jgi:hypothetical protein
MSTPTRFRLYYLDDSGAADTGYTTFTWLALAPEHWQPALQRWLRYRRSLARRHRILASTPLHATDLVSGRHHPAAGDHFDAHADGPAVVRAGLDVIAAIPWLTVGTAYRHGGELGKAKLDLYRAVLEHLDTELEQADAMGIILMDGAADHRLIKAHHQHHRTSHRRLIEQPQFHQSTSHQWVQMADLAAWSAYQAIARNPARAHTWNWYRHTVGRHDAHGPLAL